MSEKDISPTLFNTEPSARTTERISLHTTDFPRSVVRHRPIQHQTDEISSDFPKLPRASRLIKRTTPKIENITQSGAPTNVEPTSWVKQQGMKIPARKQEAKDRWSKHWWLLLATGMLIVLAGGFLLQQITGWVSDFRNDWQYGNPRTYHVDAFVGHEEGDIPSHFIVTNIKGHIHIIQFPGGDASKARIFTGPRLSGDGAELIPATVTFDNTRDEKYPDMYLRAGSMQIIFMNKDGTFRIES